MHVYLVCFDISDDRARRDIGRLLLHYGSRVQESVFEIMLKDASQLQSLRQCIAKKLEHEHEVRFYRLCCGCRKQSFRLDDAPLADFPSVEVV